MPALSGDSPGDAYVSSTPWQQVVQDSGISKTSLWYRLGQTSGFRAWLLFTMGLLVLSDWQPTLAAYLAGAAFTIAFITKLSGGIR